MQNKYTTAIRGLSIAAIVLSAIALLGSLIGAAILAITGSFIGGDMMEMLAYEFMYDYSYDYYFMSGVSAITDFVLGIIGLVIGSVIIGRIVSLVAGILGTRHAATPAKLNLVFGWGIAGAIAAFLGGRLITMALLIIAAILAKKTHDDAEKAQWQNTAAAQGYNPNAQPAYAQNGYVPVTQPVASPEPQQVPVQAAPQYTAQQPAQPTSYQQAYAQQPAAAEPVILEAQPAQAPASEPAVEVAEITEVIEVVGEPTEAENPKA